MIHRLPAQSIMFTDKQATEFVRTLVKIGDKVTIEFDVQRRDRYRKLLAYAYLTEGTTLNQEIVKAGYANR